MGDVTMKKRCFALTIGLVVFGMISGAVQAQSQNGNRLPAEFPPASYSANQYVDSRGCVFIRAGVTGAVTWVPRVTRARQLVCGFKPTSTNSTRTAAVSNAPAPEIITVDQPRAQTTAQTITQVQTPKPVVKTPLRKVATQPAAKPAPKIASVVAAPTRATRTTRAASGRCQGASAISSQYFTTSRGNRLRCGPQAVHPSDAIKSHPSAAVTTSRSSAVSNRRTVTVNGRNINKRVYYTQKLSAYEVEIPNGYIPAWSDDRLNPYRGHTTTAGDAQTDRIWTRTLPRRLDTSAGADLPDQTDLLQNGVSRNLAPTGGIAVANVTGPKATGQKRTRVTNAGKIYVHVAYYNSRSDGHVVAQDLAQAGIPARIAKIRNKGRYYTKVSAGPYQSRKAAQAELNRIRAMGFANAKLR